MKGLPRSQFPSLFIAFALALAVSILVVSVALLEETVGTVSAQQQEIGQDLTLHSDNGAPRGIWSDGSTMWIADFADRKLYAYSLADASRLDDKDIALGSTNFKPLGLWSDATTMWALNTRDDKIYGYSVVDGSRDESKDISLDVENDVPAGIWSDGTTMYVVDQIDKKLFAYSLSGGARESDKDIAIGFDRPRPIGIWSDETSFWLSYDDHQDYSDDDDRRLYAFSLKDGAREEDLDVAISTEPYSQVSGTWSDGTTIWVTDTFYRKILAYQLPQPTPSSDAMLIGLSLGTGSLTPNFAATTTTYTASVPYDVTKVTVHATSSDSTASVAFLGSDDSELPDIDAMEAGHQLQLTVNENVIKVRVTAQDETTVQTYAVTVTRDRPNVSISSLQEEVTEGEPAELVVMREIAIPEQLDVQLSVSETESLVPTSEEGKRTVAIPSGATSTILLLATDADDDEWEVHSTVTVTIDEGDGYRVINAASSTSVLVLDNDFPAATTTLSVSPNPVSEGATTTAIITITTHEYKLPHGSGGSLGLSANAGTAQADDFAVPNQTLFEISPSDFSTTTVDGDTRYTAQYVATIATVEDSTVEVGETFEIELSKTPRSTDSLTLAQPSAVAVSILDNDATLSSLQLSGITLSPEFASHIHQYEAQAPYSQNETTVASAAGHTDSEEPTVLVGGVADPDGTVPLLVGDNEISVKVVAEDAASTATYVINVTRAKPKVSISAVQTEVDEGHIVEFLISRDTPVSEPLGVGVVVSETGSQALAASLGSRTVTIPGAATTSTTTVSTHPDDDLWEPHSVITATVNSTDAIEVQSGFGTASTLVKDNDFPEATAAIDVTPNPVSEGATVSATLTVTTKTEEEPHGRGGTLTLAPREDTAQAADYGRFGQTSFSVEPDDFDLVEVDGASRYQASYTAVVAITDDSDSESDESFRLVLMKIDAPRIELPTPATTTVVIAANDSSSDPTLSQLTVTTGELSPTFSSTTTMYRVVLEYGIERVTISPVVNSDNSDVKFLDGSNNDLLDASISDDGHQVDLAIGNNTVRVKVTAEDNVSTKTYTVVFARQKPEVSILSQSLEVLEGTSVVFTIARDAQVSEGLDVRVEVSETGAMVESIEEGIRTIVIPANSTSTTFAVSTEHDDDEWEPHSTVSAAISANSTYSIQQDAARAETTVNDDDFPAATARLSISPAEVAEGVTFELSITVTTTHDQEPHGQGGTLTLSPVGGTAVDEDYRSLSQSTFNVTDSDFSRVDLGSGSMAYRAVYTATVETIDDGESESDETIVFQLGKGANTEMISIEGPATSSVTILANDASSDATLSGITLSDGTLSPPFAATTTSYTTSVPYGVEHVTLEYSKGDSGAEVTVLDADDSVLDDAKAAPGFQVSLAVGSNVVKLRVTAEDDSAMQTYVVTITRFKPTVSILEVASNVPEEGIVAFDLARDAAVTDVLDVLVNVIETGMLLAVGEAGRNTITIPSRATSTSFTITADTDDDAWEEHSTVTASIVATSTYDIAGGLGQAHVQLEDNDFPEAIAEIELSPDPIMEGQQLTALVTVTTRADQQPHGDGGTLILSLTGDTAQPDDVELPHTVEFDIAATDFMAVVIGGADRYRATYSATTTITDDEDPESSETLTAAISKRDADRILLPVPSTSTVTIAPSDLSADAALTLLTVSEGTLSPEFASSTTDYTVHVSYGVERLTITPAASDGGATISIGTTRVSSGLGHAVGLSVGTRTIEVVVTAQDSVTTRTYSVVVVRGRPEVSISPVLPHVSEGKDVNFSVNRDAAVSDPLELQVDIVESGDLVADGAEGTRSVTIPPGATSTVLTVPTDMDDETWEEHSGVTASLAPSEDYLVKPGEGSADVTVRDDDFPEATASLSVSPNPVAEGETVTVTALVRTKAHQQPHRDGGTLLLAMEAGTAQADDYGSLSQSTFQINEADFVLDAGSNTYVSEYLATVDITWDSEIETGESFDVSLTLSTTSPPSLTLGVPNSESVRIRDFSVGLIELDLSGVNLSPQFSSDTLIYTASVPYQVVQTVVSATTTEASSQATLISLNDVPVTNGRIPLSIGQNVVAIEVVAVNSDDSRTYGITVIRERPVVGVSASTNQSTEGDVLGYTVIRTPTAPDTLDVLVEVLEDGQLIPAGSLGEGIRSVIIPAGVTSASFAVETEVDDHVWDAHSTVTVAVMASELYLIKMDEGIAETLILDDDFPESIASLSVVPASVIEGGSVTLNVDVTTVRDEEPHTDGGPLIVTTANDSAIGGIDYVTVTLSDGTLNFLESDFLQLDESGQTRYRASKQINVETTRDDVQEGVEKFVVTFDRVTEGPATTSSQIVLDASSSMQEVKIEDGPDAELSSLALSEGTLIPPFGTSTRSYAAEVSYGVEQVTVTATTSSANTVVTFHDGNDDPISDLDSASSGQQIPLTVGENIIRIKVSETYNTVLDTYTLTINRIEPVVSITSTATSSVEGDPVVFTVRRSIASSESLLVELSVTETGDMVDNVSQGEGDRSVTITGHSTSTNLKVTTEPDADWEEYSTVSASITTSENYAISTDSGRAEILVADDDFPAATATLAVAPNPVQEGLQISAVVTITTGMDQAPHRSTGAIHLSLVGVSATSGKDFTLPVNDRIAFAASDFAAFDVGGQTRYSATEGISVSTVDDGEYEGPEIFTIEILPVTEGLSPTAPQIAFDPNESFREVTISDNDDLQTGGGGTDDPPDTGGSQASVPSGSSGGGGGGGSSRTTSNRAPSFEEGGETTRTVEENSPIGTRIGARIRATDRDGDRLTYSLRGEDRGSFKINASTGRLYTAISLDREVDSRYNLAVAVSDGEGGTDSIEVTIVVTDVDEAPAVTGEQNVFHPEGNPGAIATYSANDPEKGDIRWTLSGLDAVAFDIDAGELAFRSPPDFESPTDSNGDNSYELTISASDGVHTSTLDIVVTITDLDESPSPTPTPLPTQTPAPTPIPTIVPTVTPQVIPTSAPSPAPTQTQAPQPTATPNTAPMSAVNPTTTPVNTVTPIPIPVVTTTPMAINLNSESLTDAPLPSPTTAHTPAPSELHIQVTIPTPVPTSSPSPPTVRPTPTATPSARPIFVDGGAVPAWMLLTVVFWAVLATGVGVYIHMRHR